MDIRLIQNTRVVVVSMVTLLAISTCGAQKGKGQVTNEADRVIAGINDYDIESIKQAANSNNPAYIPYLRALLKHDTLAATPVEAQATIALIKLGDKQEAKRTQCELMTNKPSMVDYIGRRMLPEIGGWFAVRSYFYMLGQDAAFLKEMSSYSSDVPLVAPPSHWAVKYLPAVVPGAPIRPISSLDDPKIPLKAKQWKLWILHNQYRLQTMKPQGEMGLAFSDGGCQVAAQKPR